MEAWVWACWASALALSYIPGPFYFIVIFWIQELPKLPRLASNLKSSCLCLWSGGITGQAAVCGLRCFYREPHMVDSQKHPPTHTHTHTQNLVLVHKDHMTSLVFPNGYNLWSKEIIIIIINSIAVFFIERGGPDGRSSSSPPLRVIYYEPETLYWP